MNTKTILSIKTDKDLKKHAQDTAKELGITLTTVVNSLLKQFVRDKEVTLTERSYKPSKYLIEILEEAERERAAGLDHGPFDNMEDMIRSLKE